ncbi:MAG: methyltransferase [Deltaproteobacteria bacterium]
MALPPCSVLERCLGEPGYTPPQAALPELLMALCESPARERESLERSIARSGGAAVTALLAALDTVTEERRTPLLALATRLCSQVREPAARATLRAVLVSELEQGDPASRKWAARGLGKLGDPSAETTLLRALASAAGTETKSLVDALAVLGGAASLEPLRRIESSDADLERRRERALALIERRGARDRASGLALDRPLGRACPIVLSCRAGLAELLASELCELGLGSGEPEAFAAAPAASATSLVITHAGTLRALLAARLAVDVALRIPLDAAIGDPMERIAAALTRRETLDAVASFCDGLPRFRVAWSDGGHHRSRVWALAQSVRRRSSEILNDSQRALWTARVRSDGQGPLDLAPRLDPDPRFAYRVSEVRAASHPTLAAALARFAGAQEREVVWDPFVGSGLELVERARLGPVAELWGSDIDARALAAARANLDAAGLPTAILLERSALEFAPAGVSLILTNPPMGRRLARDGSLAELLEQFVRHAARVLRPKGRLVWLSPLSRQTERAARAAGLEVDNGPNVDLGGFDARLQTCTQRP